MCGILGWIGSQSVTAQSRVRVDAALKRLHGRGPNGSQIESGPDWLLGHTRLKILDLTDRAAQPMRDDAGRWLVFNGEIYNFKEIRSQLQGNGYQFRSTGDTEVVLYALSHWGVEAVEKLHGMFAFAWLDPKRQEIILARDRFGVKPLVWETTEDGIRFASDLFALDEMSGGGREIDPESARDYLMLGYVPAPRCIWRGPRKVVPGRYVRVRWQNGAAPEITERDFWSIRQVPPATNTNDSNTDGQFLQRIQAAVQSRLVSDVPVGLLLSGGIDSSVVAVACAELPAEEANVPAYTMGFADANSDERVFARAVANSLGIRHEEFVAEASDLPALFESTWTAYDEPFADSSALPMLLLCREISKRVTVAIGGDGGDEVWCGYPWHRALYRAEKFSWIPSGARRAFARVGGFTGRISRYQGSVFVASDRTEAWAALKTGLTNESARFLPIDAEPIPPRSCFENAAGQLDNIRDPLDWACRMDLMTYLPDDLMVKADRASMTVGLELREPLLHYGLVEWGLTLPVNQRFDFRKRQGKQPARRYLSRRFGKTIANRGKQGFTPPLPIWLAGPLREWREQAVRELESGGLAPLCLPAGCSSWSQCSNLLDDAHQQFLWRVVCFSGWKDNRKRALASFAQDTTSGSRSSEKRERAEMHRRA